VLYEGPSTVTARSLIRTIIDSEIID